MAKAGIHPGTVLEKWVHGELEEKGAGTLGALKTKCDLKDIVFEKVATESHLKSLQVGWRVPRGPCGGGALCVRLQPLSLQSVNILWLECPSESSPKSQPDHPATPLTGA